MKHIAVFCGSSLGHNTTIVNTAQHLGKVLAKQHINLVYGAAKIGIMGTVAKSVLQHNGTVTGIIPKFLAANEIVDLQLTELIFTETMHQRKQLFYDKSDGFIILPGGLGTLDELFEIATWQQLGLHTKPIGILNIDGYYNGMIQQLNTMVASGFLKQGNLNAILVANTVEDILAKMNSFVPLPKPNWLNL